MQEYEYLYCPKCGNELPFDQDEEPSEDEKSYMIADSETGGYCPRESQ